jgi:hypothetical protein
MQKEYQRCNFSREIPKSEITKLHQQLETEQTKSAMYEARLNSVESQLKNALEMLKVLSEKKETA